MRNGGTFFIVFCVRIGVFIVLFFLFFLGFALFFGVCVVFVALWVALLWLFFFTRFSLVGFMMVVNIDIRPDQSDEIVSSSSEEDEEEEEDDEKDWRDDIASVGPKRAPFRVHKKIGSGSFGAIFMGKSSDGRDVAIKIEDSDNRTSEVEMYAMKLLWDTHKDTTAAKRGEIRIPEQLWAGHCRGGGRAIVMPRFGPNLHEAIKKFNKRGRVTPLLAVAFIAETTLAMEQIHEAGLVHRDIKPENMLFGPPGTPDAGKIFFVDFGLSTTWEPKKDAARAALADQGLSKGRVVGTARYTSTHTHRGAPAAPRDDLESLAYVLLSILRGGSNSLPWVGVAGDARGRERFRRVARAKRHTTTRQLREGINDKVMADFAIGILREARTMPFDAIPDYAKLRKLSRWILDSMGYEGIDPTIILGNINH